VLLTVPSPHVGYGVHGSDSVVIRTVIQGLSSDGEPLCRLGMFGSRDVRTG
jgi:hypothetical protein